MKIPFSVYDFFGLLSAGLIWCAVGDYFLGLGVFGTKSINAPSGAVLIVVAYVVGHINANLSSAVLEQVLVGKVLGRPQQILFAPKKSKLAWFFPGYYRPLASDEITRARVKAEIAGVTVGTQAFFSHARTVSKTCERTWNHMQVFIAQYGFCRNIAFALGMLAVVTAVLAISRCCYDLAWVSATLLIAAVGMFYRYLKFFRQYTYEMFTAYPDLSRH